MGSMITLGIGKFEINWGKNNYFLDHSILFQPLDIKQIPYYYADNIIEYKDGLSKKISSIKKRLDLLGYSYSSLQNKYEEHIRIVPDYYPEVPIAFDAFKAIINNLDIERINLNFEREDFDLGEYASKYIFADPEVVRHLPEGIIVDDDLGTFFENLDPYITLRLIAEKEENADLEVQWRYADVVESGWVTIDVIFKPLDTSKKIMIVTEGSSDLFIIKRTLEALYPDISDFFSFIDMQDNYPFTGTGNLYKFCQGLSRINILNNIIIIFDNDVAGLEKYNQCRELSKPRNLHICKLPDHEFFANFKTMGPNGISFEDINGSAVAIECFLDLDEECSVRWTSFNRELGKYQGEIENKERYVRIFKDANLDDGSYNTERLRFLIDYLINQWVANVY